MKKVLTYLGENEAVLTGSHFIFTSGNHGTSYINMRAVAHDASWMSHVGQRLAHRLLRYEPDIIIGPETLGRNLAQFTAPWLGVPGIWCDIIEDDERKWAEFSPKLDFARLVPGKRVAIVDDLLTTGSSIRMVSELVFATGGDVVAGAAVVRRTPDVGAVACCVPELEVLADVEGFAVFTEEECRESGPCSERVPVVLRPGHGWKWAEVNPDYPTAPSTHP